MISRLLNALPAGGKDIGAGEGALDALIGYLVVFLGIAFLIFVVWAVGKGMEAFQRKAAKAKSIPQMESPKETIEKVSEEELSEETIAVIMAALTAFYETNNPKCEFTVKRIKRI